MESLLEKSKSFLISFDSPRLGYGKVVLDNPFKSGIPDGVTVIVGDNGSGKTTLGIILEKGRYAYGNRLTFSDEVRKVKMIAFTDIHSLTGIDVSYFNQRMEATANEYVPLVSELFWEKAMTPEWCFLSDCFHLKDIMDKRINYLSSGELRKLLIINALSEKPDLLILDNPYIGLDAPSRNDFNEAIKRLRNHNTSIVFLLCDYNDIPDFADTLIEMKKCEIGAPITIKGRFEDLIRKRSENFPHIPDIRLPEKLDNRYPLCQVVFSIVNGHARYGDKIIFDGVDWTVRRGESWALTGKNGSGKSLLLSMVCADNPQGYANNIVLFDRRRGSGESIWEIKDAIGYVCPEMQLYFRSNDNVREIIVQGLRNTLNRYRASDPLEQSIADEWLRLLEISNLADRKFSELSSGEQRLVLVARAMIKQPDLLVLDEPLHGLDKRHKELIKNIISGLVKRNGSSLIFVTHYDSEMPSCINNVKRLGI